jgi:hypothetical protein
MIPKQDIRETTISIIGTTTYGRSPLFKSKEGWYGIPASAFRSACIQMHNEVSKKLGFRLSSSRLPIFVLPDGQDERNGEALVRITKGKPEDFVLLHGERTCTRKIPTWRAGWKARLRLKYDACVMKEVDVFNTIECAGATIRVGDWRSMGWGAFSTMHKSKGCRSTKKIVDNV